MCIQIISIYFAFILFHQCSFVDCTFAYTCPIGSVINDKLITIRESILCNRTLNCASVNGIFKSIYQNFVIVLRTGFEKWNDINVAVDSLSKCGIRNVVLNGRDIKSPNMTEFCSEEKVTVVLTLTTINLNFIEKSQSSSTCMYQDVALNDPEGIISNILSTCPNTAWITGTTVCDKNLQHSTARLHHIIDNNETFVEFNMTRRMRIAAVAYKAFLFNESTNDTIKYSGPIIELLDRLSHKLDFGYDIYPSVDKQYGIKNNTTNKWNGMMGMLERKEVDMIAAALTVTESRAALADFTAPFYYEPYSIIIQEPGPADKLWNALSVFSKNVWIAIICSALIAIIITYIVHKFAAKPANTGFEQFSGCLWYITSGLVNQGGELEPKSWSAQNFLAFWWLYVVAIIAVYSGLLVAQLSIGKMNLPFTNLNEFTAVAATGKYKFCIPKSTALQEAIEQGISEDYRMLRKMIKQYPEFVKDESECIEYLKQTPNVAFLSEESQLVTVQRDNCRTIPMIIIPDRFQAGYFGFALQKDSPLKGLFSIEIREAFDAGLIDTWKERNADKHKSNIFCDVATPDNIVKSAKDKMGLEEMKGSFTLLSMGILISFIAFSLEMFTFFQKHYKVKKL